MSILQNEVDEANKTKPLPRATLPALIGRLRALGGGPPVFHLPRRRSIPRPSQCLNCGDSLTGNFCANCGQEAVDERTALWPLISDVLSEFARWDSKFLRTLLPLLFRPGYLTKEYISGRRATYLAPFRMFLSVSVLFFLLLTWRGSNLIKFDTASIVTTTHSSAHALTRQQLAGVADARKSLAKDGISIPPLDHAIDKIEPGPGNVTRSLPVQSSRASSNRSGLHVSHSSLDQDNSGPVTISGGDLTAILRAWNSLQTMPAATEQQLADASSPTAWKQVPLLLPGMAAATTSGNKSDLNLDHLPTTAALYNALQANKSYPYKDRSFWRRVVNRLYKFGSNHAEFTESLYGLASKVAIILVPIFALLMYPLYLRTRRYYVEHLVFSLHNHTFLFIATAVSMLTRSWVAHLLSFLVPVYMFASMQVVYRQHWLKTLLKFGVVSSIYLFLLVIAVCLTFTAALFYG